MNKRILMLLILTIVPYKLESMERIKKLFRYNKEECGICFNYEFSNKGLGQVKLCCTHLMCTECAYQICKSNNVTCPFCRADIGIDTQMKIRTNKIFFPMTKMKMVSNADISNTANGVSAEIIKIMSENNQKKSELEKALKQAETDKAILKKEYLSLKEANKSLNQINDSLRFDLKNSQKNKIKDSIEIFPSSAVKKNNLPTEQSLFMKGLLIGTGVGILGTVVLMKMNKNKN